jgi:hypothetical protein
MDSKELFKQFWAVGDESVWGDETNRMWKVWQAAWNARQPEANMLDLGGLESHPIVEWYTMLGASDEQELVRYSDLTNAAEVSIPTAVLSLLNQIENLTFDDDYRTVMNLISDHAKEAMALLTKSRGGAV